MMRVANRYRLLCIATAALLCAQGVCAQGLWAQGAFAAPPVTTDRVVLLGAVQTMGDYRFDVATISLGELIHHAGGLTPTKSGHYRILRDGRQFISLSGPQAMETQVLPGDVVVAGLLPGHDQPLTGENGRSFVEVAFVGLLPTPVMIPLDAQQATVPQILELIGLPAESAPHIKVVGPPGVHTDPQLISRGSVLLFPQPMDAPQAEEFLAGLPQPHRVQPRQRPTRTVAASSPFDSPDIASQAAIVVEANAPVPADRSPVDRSPAASSPTLLIPPAPSQSAVADDMMQHATSPATEQRPADSPAEPVALSHAIEPAATHAHANSVDRTESIERAATIDVVSMQAPPTTRVGVAQASAVELAPARISESASSEATSIEPIAGNDSFINSMIIAIVATLLAAGSFAASLLWLRWDHGANLTSDIAAGSTLEQTPSPDGAPTAAFNTPQLLDALIENRFPLIEEDVLVPAAIHFHGSVVGQHRLIINQAHDLQAPHFTQSKKPSQQADTRSASSRSTGTKAKRAQQGVVAPPADKAIRRQVVLPEAATRVDQSSRMAVDPGGARQSVAAPKFAQQPVGNRRPSAERVSTADGGLLQRIVTAMEKEQGR